MPEIRSFFSYTVSLPCYDKCRKGGSAKRNSGYFFLRLSRRFFELGSTNLRWRTKLVQERSDLFAPDYFVVDLDALRTRQLISLKIWNSIDFMLANIFLAVKAFEVKSIFRVSWCSQKILDLETPRDTEYVLPLGGFPIEIETKISLVIILK